MPQEGHKVRAAGRAAAAAAGAAARPHQQGRRRAAHRSAQRRAAPALPAWPPQVTLMALMVSHYPLRMDQNMRQATEVAKQVTDS